NADGSASFFDLPTALQVIDGFANYYRTVSVAAHPNGSIWYTDTDAVARLTRDGDFTRFPLPDGDDLAESMVVGGDGNLWFLENRIHLSPDLDAYYVAGKI